MKGLIAGVFAAIWLIGKIAAKEPGPPQAARSVHLWYAAAPSATLFYNELTIEESQSGSYFMACGFTHGYFGMQELMPGQAKVVLFSVWDPGRQDDPKSVASEDRVEVLFESPDVRVKRFGGEGTGGQCFFRYPWRIGETCKFIVTASTNGNKTAYAAWFYLNDKQEWKHLVTFQTQAGGDRLEGCYSFVEDFRRDGLSARQKRQAQFGNGWVKSIAGNWLELTKATFTADQNPSMNINASANGHAFQLVTGGGTKNTTRLKSILSRPALNEKPLALRTFHEF